MRACRSLSRRHQHPVHHLPAIILNRIPRERGHSTIRFLHDQIRRGKIPVAALAACKSGIEADRRRPGTAEAPAIRSADAAVISSGDALSRCTSGFGPAMRGKSRSLPEAARTGAVVERGALPARIAKKNSSLTGRIHRRQHRRVACNQRHTDAPVLAAGEIGPCAVDRVDDPGQLPCRDAIGSSTLSSDSQP